MNEDKEGEKKFVGGVGAFYVLLQVIICLHEICLPKFSQCEKSRNIKGRTFNPMDHFTFV